MSRSDTPSIRRTRGRMRIEMAPTTERRQKESRYDDLCLLIPDGEVTRKKSVSQL